MAPLTHAVGNVLKQVFVIGFSIIVFGELFDSVHNICSHRWMCLLVFYLVKFQVSSRGCGRELVASLASECCTPVLWLLACSCVPDYFSEWHPSISFLCHRCRKDGLFYYVAKCCRFIKPSCIRVWDYCTCLVYRQQNFNPNWNWNCYSNRWYWYLLLHQGKVGGR